MDKVPKSVNPVTVVGGLLGSYLIYKAFSKNKNIKKVSEIKKWINWKVEFKENTSQIEKANAMVAVKRYILDYINSSKIEIASLKFSENNRKPNLPNLPKMSNNTTLSADLISLVSKDAVHPPTPPPHPPILPDPEKISPAVADIQLQR